LSEPLIYRITGQKDAFHGGEIRDERVQNGAHFTGQRCFCNVGCVNQEVA